MYKEFYVLSLVLLHEIHRNVYLPQAQGPNIFRQNNFPVTQADWHLSNKHMWEWKTPILKILTGLYTFHVHIHPHSFKLTRFNGQDFKGVLGQGKWPTKS